jgi:pimeloyl-ACP methyl ester carboxylesterase
LTPCVGVTIGRTSHDISDTSFTSYGDVSTASDLAALLAELGKSAVVVGNSMAAGSAVIVAAEHPEHIDGLVLVGAFVRQPSSDSVLTRAVMRVLMAPLWAPVVWQAFLPRLYAGKLPHDFADYRSAVVSSIKRPGYARAFSLTTRTDHRHAGASLERINTPALVIMGRNDPDFKDASAEGEWIVRALNGRAVTVEEAGHYPQSQQPEAFASMVLDFLVQVTDRA